MDGRRNVGAWRLHSVLDSARVRRRICIDDPAAGVAYNSDVEKGRGKCRLAAVYLRRSTAAPVARSSAALLRRSAAAPVARSSAAAALLRRSAASTLFDWGSLNKTALWNAPRADSACMGCVHLPGNLVNLSKKIQWHCERRASALARASNLSAISQLKMEAFTSTPEISCTRLAARRKRRPRDA